MTTPGKFEGTAKNDNFFTLKSSENKFERIIYHCPDCFDIPLIQVNQDLISANSVCQKYHKYDNISLEVLYQKLMSSSISIESLKSNKTVVCFKCKESLEIKDSTDNLEKVLNGFGYCQGCQNIICINCVKAHNEDIKKDEAENHKVIPLDKYTNYCPLHGYKYSAYCLDCQKNTCVKCIVHRKHKKYHFDDYLLFDEDVNKYKKQIINLRTNCENLENKINSILDIIRNEFHEEMKKQINLLDFNELLLDAYQTNQFNYFYLQNILNNYSYLENVEKKVNIQDIKNILVDLINNCDITQIDQFKKINPTHGELLHVSQPSQMTKQFKPIDYNKDTVKDINTPTFQENGNKSNENNDIITEMTNDSKNSSFINNNNSMKLNNSLKNNNINNLNNSTKNNNNINNSIKEGFKSTKNEKENDINNGMKNSINSTVQDNNDILKGSIHLNDIVINQSIKSTKKGNEISCEFIGKNYASDSYDLNDLPNNIETTFEIKNTGDTILPKGCYLFDENNCSSLMILDNVLNSIEPGKSIYKQIKLEMYIYSKGTYQIKLSVKDPNGNFISKNQFEFNLIVE